MTDNCKHDWKSERYAYNFLVCSKCGAWLNDADDIFHPPVAFHVEDWLFIKDVERCPYVMWSTEAIIWNEQQDKKSLLTALDRYANYITSNSKPEADTERIRRHEIMRDR